VGRERDLALGHAFHRAIISDLTMRPSRDLFWAWLAATVLGGLPSTLLALATGGDPTEATRAAGAMLLPGERRLATLVAAAAVVHAAVSFFWAAVLAALLPSRRMVAWSLVAAALIALLDLRVIAPRFFPEVAALAFWPQFADHLMWGATVGAVLAHRARLSEASPSGRSAGG
jgi:hypothetical protein